MQTPFGNDMFSMVYQAFKNLYPDKDCECEWQADMGEGICGLTSFTEDGRVFVDISTRLTVLDAVEILAHELAHVAVGEKGEEDDHGEEWEHAFDAIHNEFDRIGDEMFPDEGVVVKVTSGKDYVKE